MRGKRGRVSADAEGADAEYGCDADDDRACDDVSFIADRMLGKLCVWLRILGYDTIYAGQVLQRLNDDGETHGDEAHGDEAHGDIEDNLILNLALKEHRILLTRDKQLATHARARGAMCILLRSDDLNEQLRELASCLNLNLEPVARRCSECNAPIRLVREDEVEELLINKEYVPKALIHRTDFWVCEGCGRIYWEGSHWRAIRRRLETIKKETSPGRRIAVGGTFDTLHDGHKMLLETVYELSAGGYITIGLTSDTFARIKRERAVLSFKARAENLRQYMRRKYHVNVRIVELNDRYGVTLDEDFDYIVISPETYNVAVKINKLRRERGKKEIKIVKVPHLLAEDGMVISATRIKRGEIDRHGNVL